MKVLNPVYSLESNWGFGTKSWSSETGSQWTANNWWRCWEAPPCPRRRCWPYLTLLSMLLGSRFWCNIIPTTILPSQKLYFMEENINYHLTTLKWQWIKCLQNIRKEGVEWQFFPFLSRHVLNVSSLQSLNICLLQLLLILLLADLENWKENCFNQSINFITSNLYLSLYHTGQDGSQLLLCGTADDSLLIQTVFRSGWVTTDSVCCTGHWL